MRAPPYLVCVVLRLKHCAPGKRLPTEPLRQPWAVVSSEAGKGGHESVGAGLSTQSWRVEGTAWLSPPSPFALHPSASRLMGSHLSLTYLPVTPVAHPRTIKELFVCKHLASSSGPIHHACGRRGSRRRGGRAGSQGPRLLLSQDEAVWELQEQARNVLDPIPSGQRAMRPFGDPCALG